MRTAILAALFLCSACGAETGDSAPFVYDNLLFTGATSLAAAVSPSGSSTPNVSWPATERPLVAAGFFARHIDVRQGEITNSGDLVWLWHSGLGTGREGDVVWSDGAPVVGGTPREGERPGPLPSGTYYWGVWAFDEAGDVTESTLEGTHVVP